ncbi:hypothetical protein ACSTS3_21225 [Aquimarina muelleri]|uniref:hypothetical protein n=1 Tax=Aquimarina muelleri TaxID=279356 RepID=UPI003F683979
MQVGHVRMNLEKFKDRDKGYFDKGYRIHDVEIVNGKYTAVWRKGSGGQWWKTGLTLEQLKENNSYYMKNGYRIHDFEFINGKYTVVWRASSDWQVLSVGMSLEEFKEKDQNLFDGGYRIHDVEIFNGKYTVVWRNGSGGQYWKAGMSFEQFEERNKHYFESDYRIVDFEIVNGQYTAVWKKMKGPQITLVGLSLIDFKENDVNYFEESFRLADIEFPQEDNCYTDPNIQAWKLAAEKEYVNKAWTEECQGVTTDGQFWYITSNNPDKRAVYKFTLNMQLVDQLILKSGYNHIGDLDYHNGKLYVALEWPTGVLEISTEDFKKIGIYHIETACSNNLPWVAIHPTTGYLYTSVFGWDESSCKYVDEVNYYEKINCVYQKIGSVKLAERIKHVQGGDISENCKLILSSDYSHDIKCYNVDTGQYYGSKSVDVSSGFSEYEEMEGLCISPFGSEKMGSSVHLILLDNDSPSGDDVFFKHYNLPNNGKGF